MRCPTCKTKALRANPDDHEGSEWWICPNPSCTQVAWPRGKRSPRGERSPLVDQLVSLTEEQRERAAHTHVGRLT